MVAKALLMQSLFISMVGAERMRMTNELAIGVKKGTPAEKLQGIFRDKDNQICGGTEVRDELTKGTTVGGMRTTNWEKVLKIATKYMDKVGLELPTLTSQVEELEKKLKQAQKDAEYAELTEADIESAIISTISKKNTFWSQEIAKKSGCGFDANAINRPNKKKNREIARLAKKGVVAKYQACKLETKDNYDSNEIQL